MANFPAVKVGGWAFRDPITAAQITGIQEQLLKCPNFSEGSSHSPTGLIEILGAFGISIATLVTTGVLSFGDTGRIRFRPGFTSSMSGNVNRGVTDAAIEAFGDLGGSDRTLTLSHTNALAGDWKIYLHCGSANNLLIADETAGTMATVPPHGLAVCFYEDGFSRWRAAYGS